MWMIPRVNQISDTIYTREILWRHRIVLLDYIMARASRDNNNECIYGNGVCFFFFFCRNAVSGDRRYCGRLTAATGRRRDTVARQLRQRWRWRKGMPSDQSARPVVYNGHRSRLGCESQSTRGRADGRGNADRGMLTNAGGRTDTVYVRPPPPPPPICLHTRRARPVPDLVSSSAARGIPSVRLPTPCAPTPPLRVITPHVRAPILLLLLFIVRCIQYNILLGIRFFFFFILFVCTAQCASSSHPYNT